VTSAGGNDVLFGDGGQVTFSAGGVVLTIASVDVDIGGNDTLDGAAGNDILIGGFGDDLLYGSLSEDLLFGSYATVILTGGFVTSIAADHERYLLTAAMLGQFDGIAAHGSKRSLSSLFEGLPGYAAMLPTPFGDQFADGFPARCRCVPQGVPHQPFLAGDQDELDASMFEEAVRVRDGHATPTSLAWPGYLNCDETGNGAGPDDGAPVASKELASPLAFERAAPADTDPSDGDLVVAALGLTGLHAVQHSQSRPAAGRSTGSARRTGRPHSAGLASHPM
jgi:Ca2+-binding RTX toxin-like protein